MRAVGVIAYPSTLYSTCVKLGAGHAVNPDPLPPLGQPCKVRFFTVKEFVWRGVPDDMSGRAILKPSCKLDGLCPEGFGQVTAVQDRAHAFDELVVQGLGDPVVLRHIVRGEAPLGALLPKKQVEVTAGGLATAVGSKALDAHAVLSISPCRKRLISGKGFVFSGDVRTHVAVCERDVLFSAPQAIVRGGAPDVRVDFLTKSLAQGASRSF
jgi:hypothetical protein